MGLPLGWPHTFYLCKAAHMTYYHKTKADAMEAGSKYEEHFDVYTAMEPYNGHVIKLVPKSIEVLKFPLYDLLEEVELDLTRFNLVRRRPADRISPPPLERTKPKARGASSDGKPSPSGATGKVWLIADRVHAEKGLDRKAIMDACVAEGINPSTAGTQYAKWKKAKGL